jgi:DNA-binding SARP family transcriptional activator
MHRLEHLLAVLGWPLTHLRCRLPRLLIVARRWWAAGAEEIEQGLFGDAETAADADRTQLAACDRLVELVAADRYRVDPTVFAVDLWRFQQALAAARHAQLNPAVAAALAQAGEAYGGVLLDGAPYAWVEVPREEVRRRAVDALARLAELRQAAGDQQGALSALEQAVAADPVAEELYRRVMRLEAELDRPDAVRRTYRLLARRLADLDVDPDPETEQLVAELLRRPGA